MMKARVKWLDHMSFVGESDSGHSVVMDGAPDAGGRNLGLRPMEMLLLGMGGCTTFDVVMILQRGRQQVTGCETLLDAERAVELPQVFTRIHVHFVISGCHLSEQRVAKAIELSAQKYCSASLMLGVMAAITYDFETVDTCAGY